MQRLSERKRAYPGPLQLSWLSRDSHLRGTALRMEEVKMLREA